MNRRPTPTRQQALERDAQRVITGAAGVIGLLLVTTTRPWACVVGIALLAWVGFRIKAISGG